MYASIVLTVAQSKRLIAKAVAALPQVQRALKEGMVAIGRGTTNAYVAEEILGHELPKGEYVAGRTMPKRVPGNLLGTGKYPDIVLKHGEAIDGATVVGAVAEMGPDDVFIKGGNALNYPEMVVGILVGHPTGGTIGGTYGTIISRKIHLIIPIGLEKLIQDDINELSCVTRDAVSHPAAPVVSLFPITGAVITEIEAFAILCDVEARLLSAGGVAGAEGAVWLLLEGGKRELDVALALYESLADEPNLTVTQQA
ncbi:MAG: hypothetical protein BWY76_03190 [bacterium ADurb.Bin429]|nr:MAG: hypothetical protein BWY76_03190 [bacterium ADurb.Bin429]